jgi:hypothetical protein
MDVMPPYRVMTRLQALLILGAILAVGALVVWLGTAWIDGYLARMDSLQISNPEEIVETMITHLKVLAVFQLLPLLALCGFMVWYCSRAIATRSLPPPGSWIVEGQRIRTGASAVRNAWIALALTGVIAIAGIVATIYVYAIAASLQDRAAGA